MNISKDQLQYRKRIGHLGARSIIEVGVIGGLKIVAVQEASGKLKTLGAGSHRAIARFLAKKAEPDLEIDALEKSDEINYNDFKDLLPFWEQVSNQMRN
jgi:hypothetical protein